MDAFESHPFRFLWTQPVPPTAAESSVAVEAIERLAADLILRNEPDPASASALGQLFMPYHQNGTFSIGVRRARPYPPFVRGETPDFRLWAQGATRSDLVRMLYGRALPATLTSDRFETIASVVADALQYRGTGGVLCDQIPNQNYIDYVRRCIGLYVCKDADVEFDSETDYNEFALDVAFRIIESTGVATRPPSVETLRTLMIYSLAAGVIGLDLKCSHCAASQLTPDNAATSRGDSADRRVGPITEWLERKAQTGRLFCPELFAWEDYADRVLRRPCVLFFFPDDLGETVFDVVRLQAELSYNRNLTVMFVPRRGRFHNDCAVEDAEELFRHRCFAELRRFRDQGRFVVSANGPRNGAVEAAKMNASLVDSMLTYADVLFFKGSRTYEMVATGIRLPTFSGQTVAREFSESVTGADAAAGVPILRFFHVFPDYWGFTERHRRTQQLFPTGRQGWMASMTAMESARCTKSPGFRLACSRRSIEDVSMGVMRVAEERGVPPHLVDLTLTL